ncbi:hypothetical protein PGQ11_010440 [Apiospora arundinis]|uniref:Uncharacterized protein n=1 Tax=Apiospora arundinis TaxID=335852 RepID=A0ABR2IA60_9PEZI
MKESMEFLYHGSTDELEDSLATNPDPGLVPRTCAIDIIQDTFYSTGGLDPTGYQLLFELRRYQALYVLHDGQYEVATSILEEMLRLIEDDTDILDYVWCLTKAQIQRDLAVANLYMGPKLPWTTQKRMRPVKQLQI